MKDYKVYIHIFPNNKVYIGVTKQKPKYRWANGTKYNNNQHMKNAIKKYGWNNIKHIILFENLTKEEAEQKEIELIKEYKANIREYGYNILAGGNVSKGMTEEGKRRMIEKNKGKHRSPETEFKKGGQHIPWNTGKKMSNELRQKLSEAHKGIKLSDEAKAKLSKNNGRYWLGKHRSEETKRKISESNKGKKEKTGYWLGKHHSNETKQKISKSKIGTVSTQRKKVICIETNITYDSLTKASEETHTNITHISQCCNNKRKTTGGFHWKYA